MKVNVTFKQVNSDFDKTYANQYSAGKESVDNMKHKWSKSYDVDVDVDKIVVRDNEVFSVDNLLIDDKKVLLELPNMYILECVSNNEVVNQFAVSKSLLKNIQKPYNKKYNILRFYFYLNDREDYVQLGKKIYLVKSDIPKELLELK